MKTTIRPNTKSNRQYLGQAIRQGELVAFPTETVYGIGADTTKTQAVQSIFDAKQRPADNPLIVHVADKNGIRDYGHIHYPLQETVINQLMPGPITMVLPHTGKASALVTANLDTIALRIPAHQSTIELIKSAKTGIAAPSANRSGKPSPTSAQAVYQDLNGIIPHILDGGHTPIGIESTVVKVMENEIAILRPGYITREDIQTKRPRIKVYYSTEHQHQSPGMRYKHYAPNASVTISDNLTQTLINETSNHTAVIATKESLDTINQNQFPHIIRKERGTQTNLASCASSLYRIYNELDQINIDTIIIEQLPETGLGYAIMNRVKKSSGLI